MIRRIGIDFGTSTTVLQTKNYENDGVTPIGDRIDTKDVKFGKQSFCDTCVKQKQDRWYCGLEAVKNIPDAKLYYNFKMQLESSDAGIAAEAREATLHFFEYLYKTYAEQRDNGQFGEKAEREETLVSYPVKWRQDTAEFLLQAAQKAGFPNIRHMNEARAAISAVLVQSMQQTTRQEMNDRNILLCDMGAGTCDLVLCRYKVADGGVLEILTCWPRGEDTLTFGGREIDARLQEYIVNIMEKNGLPVKRLKSSLNEFRIWKELEVSPMLAEGYPVESCDIIENAANGDCIDYPPMTREIFESITQTQMQDFIHLINGALDSCDEPISQIDLAILVGGNSQWYFIGDLLSGKQIGDCAVDIPISPKQVICPPNPQMTVAMGLVLSDLPMRVTNEEVIEKAAAPDRQGNPVVETSSSLGIPLKGIDKSVERVLNQEGMEVLKRFLIQMGQDSKYTSQSTQYLKAGETSLANDPLRVCNRVRKGMNLLEDMKFYFAHDGTSFENGKIGLFLCDKGIGGRTMGGFTRLFSWDEFVNGRWSISNTTLVYNDDTLVAAIYTKDKTMDQDHVTLQKIMELQNILKHYLISVEGNEADMRQAKIRDIVREEIRTLKWGHLLELYSIDQTENTIDFRDKSILCGFMEKWNVDKKKEIYAWCDLSGIILNRGDGILITEAGIYYKEIFESMRFVSWETVVDSDGGFRFSGDTITFAFQSVFQIYRNVTGGDSEEKRVAIAREVYKAFCRIESRIRKLD